MFPKYGEHEKEITYPILLSLCENCGLVQLNNTATPDSMYKTGQYGYKSSISNTMRHHLKSYNDDMLAKKKITTENVVLDIGIFNNVLFSKTLVIGSNVKTVELE